MSGLSGRLAKLEAKQRAKDAPLVQIRLWIADEEAGVWRDHATGEAGGLLSDEGGPKHDGANILISYGEGASYEP